MLSVRLPMAGLAINTDASCAGWEWKQLGSRFTVSEDGLVATFGTPVGNGPGHELSQYDFSAQLVTCEQLMTEGRHYWEVEVMGGTLHIGTRQ